MVVIVQCAVHPAISLGDVSVEVVTAKHDLKRPRAADQPREAFERIQPGHPQQNDRHERINLPLKQQATRPAGANILQQQGKFDTFVEDLTTNDRTRRWT